MAADELDHNFFPQPLHTQSHHRPSDYPSREGPSSAHPSGLISSSSPDPTPTSLPSTHAPLTLIDPLSPISPLSPLSIAARRHISTAEQPETTESSAGPAVDAPPFAASASPSAAEKDGLVDPHDFYRHFTDPFTSHEPARTWHPPPPPDPDPADVMTTAVRPVDAAHLRGASTAHAPSSRPRRPSAAAMPVPHPTSSTPSAPPRPASATRSKSALSNKAPGSRQTSLQELVNRFNQTHDELSPSPKPRQLSASSSGSSVRPRKPSASDRAAAAHATGKQAAGERPRNGERLTNATRRPAREPRDRRETKPSGDRHAKQDRPSTSVANNPWATKSMTSLHLSQHESARQPLFGEVVVNGTADGSLLPGFGIPAPSRPRRGSDGSSPSFHPAGHRKSRSEATIPPPSPTTFYLAAPQDSVGPDPASDSPSAARRTHRRTRSDFTTAPTIHLDPDRLGHDPDAASQTPRPPPRRSESQSRIPVSTRQRPAADAPRSPAKHAAAAAAAANADSSSNAAARPTAAGTRLKPDRLSASSTEISPSSTLAPPSRRSDARSKQQRGTSPTLRAYISAPPAKSSPPLRSSRPRQPVSTATTASSRARALDASQARPRHPSTGPGRRRESSTAPKAKNIPELDAVDFAARRERIQRAFTISMRERERQNELRLERRRQRDAAKAQDGSEQARLHPPVILGPDGERASGDDDRTTSADGRVAEPRLTLDTDLPPAGAPKTARPTLNIPIPDGSNADQAPLSAVTAETAITPIDNEPQADDSEPSLEPAAASSSPPRHRTVLSQVLQLRERRSPSPTRSRSSRGSASDRDDRESIQIMLGESPIMTRPVEKPASYVSIKRPILPSYTENFRSRWSMDSFGSSARFRQSSDQGGDSPTDPTEDLAASSQSTRPTSYARDSQRWSEEEQPPVRSGHTTLNSDAYSTINRVLDHYHAPYITSPEMLQDFQQHLLTKSPELARQGGWDPTRVTQLYLEELRRGRTKPEPPSTPPRIDLHDPDAPGRRGSADEPTKDSAAASSSEAEPAPERAAAVESPLVPEMVHERDRFDLPELSSASDQAGLEVTPEVPPIHSASLQFATDWMDASPSIVDWIHPQAADSPTENVPREYRPTPPPKDWGAVESSPRHGDADRVGARTPPRAHYPDVPALTSGGEGLGLVLDGQATSTLSLPSPPPLPDHSPPPPPPAIAAALDQGRAERVRQVNAMPSPPSPSLYSRRPASAIANGKAEVTPARASDGSSQATISTTTPAQPGRTPPQPQVPVSTSSASTEATKTSEPTAEQRRLTKRRHIIRELLDTEKLFHGDMKVTEEIYKGTSNACSAVTSDDVKVLFGNIDQIVTFSLSFFDALRQAGSSVYKVRRITALTNNKRASASTSNSGPSDECSPGIGVDLSDEEKDRKTFVGEAFGQHMARLEKVYSEYLRNLEAANARLQKLQSVPGVVLWLNECRSHAEDLTDTWSLDSLIVKPMQRILKYPLLLESLSEVTPEDHPDFTALDVALWEMKAVASRIEDLMKRVHLVEQAVGRKRKDSDVRTGLSKAFGRRTEKFKQQVGLSEMFDDLDFNRVAEKWDSHVVQLQFVMSDIDKYLAETQVFVDRFITYVAAIEAFVEVSRTNYPEMESKWRRFGLAMRELASVALTEHKASVQQSVIGPMKALVRLYESPHKIIQKRNKRIMDYARYKGIKDRGDKPDKRTTEQGEQFMALNVTLKEELPKLYRLTGKLAEACLGNLVQLQARWYSIWQEKSKAILDDYQMPHSLADILSQFSGDFAFTEAQVNSLGMCNGSILADSVNFLAVQKASTADESGFRRQGAAAGTAPAGKARTRSMNSSGQSPVIPAPDFGQRNSGIFMSPTLIDGMQPSFGAAFGQPPASRERTRASSNQSSSHGAPLTPDASSIARSFYAMTPATSHSTSNAAGRPSTSTGQSGMEGNYARPSLESASARTRPASGSTSYFSVNPELQARQPSPSQRPFSGVFSSAMPMSDSPRSSAQASRSGSPRPSADRAHVLFTTASIDEFNIDRSRTEAGYPYLTYVKGEIFDVIAEKGELWLARNQDDKSQTIGWLWCKHFAKLTNGP